jgi:hypothetical protein
MLNKAAGKAVTGDDCNEAKLNSTGHNCGYADGYAEFPTMQGIAKFQETHKLGQGYLGGEDWYYLIK